MNRRASPQGFIALRTLLLYGFCRDSDSELLHMKSQLRNRRKGIKFSLDFLIIMGILVLIAAFGKPVIRWIKAEYDAYQERHTILTASTHEYQRLLKGIQVQQPNSSVFVESSISEQIFQTAISPSFLGRNNQYVPYTKNGTLACAWIVNEVIDQAVGYRVGENPLMSLL